VPTRRAVTTGRFVLLSELNDFYLAEARLNRTLRLAYLAGDGLAQTGMDQRVTCGDDYDLSREWASAIHNHASSVDGIFYPSRHHNDLHSVALFERSQSAISFTKLGALGDQTIPDRWGVVCAVLSKFQWELIL